MKFHTIIIILLFVYTAFGQSVADESETLKNPFLLTGEVTKIEITEKTSSSDVVLLKIHLKLFAKNISKENVIVLSAFNESLRAEFVNNNKERLALITPLLAGFLPDRKKIEKQLNKKKPPSEYTKILAPNEVWTFDDVISEYIPKKIERSRKTETDASGMTLIIESTDNFYPNITLGEIENFSPFFIIINFRPNLIPFNDEYKRRENFSYFDSWRDKWKNYGNLWTGLLISEPILIDINKATRK